MNKKYFPYLLAITLFLNFRGYSQGILDNRFIFSDGIYLSYEEYYSNTPSIKFQDDKMPVAKYGKFNESQFRGILYEGKDGNMVNLNLKDVWGISIKGVPYIFSGYSVVNETDISFLANTIKKTRNLILSEIIYTGNISLYSFKNENWMIKANTGKAEKITTKKVRENIEDDPDLLSQFKADKHKRRNKHSFLVKYNQKHPISLSQLAHK